MNEIAINDTKKVVRRNYMRRKEYRYSTGRTTVCSLHGSISEQRIEQQSHVTDTWDSMTKRAASGPRTISTSIDRDDHRPWHTARTTEGVFLFPSCSAPLFFCRPDTLSLLSFSLWILVSKQGMIQALSRIGSRRSSHAATINTRRMSGEASFPVTASIKAKLTKAFQPTHLDVTNESHMHNV